MTREEVYERLNGVFREVLDDDSIELHDETVAADSDEQTYFDLEYQFLMYKRKKK